MAVGDGDMGDGEEEEEEEGGYDEVTSCSTGLTKQVEPTNEQRPSFLHVCCMYMPSLPMPCTLLFTVCSFRRC